MGLLRVCFRLRLARIGGSEIARACKTIPRADWGGQWGARARDGAYCMPVNAPMLPRMAKATERIVSQMVM